MATKRKAETQEDPSSAVLQFLQAANRPYSAGEIRSPNSPRLVGRGV